MMCKDDGADFQSRFDKSIARAGAMREGRYVFYDGRFLPGGALRLYRSTALMLVKIDFDGAYNFSTRIFL
jgi:hypothetical protein